jgi:hypothetical protein
MTDITAREAVIGDNSEAMDIKAMLREEPKAIYHDTGVLPKLLAQLDKEIAAAPKDASDNKARDAIRSAAFDIAKLKSKLDNAGKDLTEDFRKKTKEVNDVRNEITGALEQRQAAMREPLTKWEEEEKSREEAVRNYRKYLEDSLTLPAGATLEKIAARRAKIEAATIVSEVFQELTELVERERANALQALDGFASQIRQAEADRLELAQMKQEKAEREAREAVERAKAVAEEAARIEREAVERERLEAIKQAEENASRAAEAKAEAQRQAAEAELRRKAQAEVDAANARAAEAERLREEMANRERAADAARQAQAEEDERRRRDLQHREDVFSAITEDLVRVAGITSTKANAIAQAIAAGSVRNVTVEF